jgi:flagellar hook assembly protein FlgD
VEVKMATIYTVKVGVYNESGELVKMIWVQTLSKEVTSIDLSTATITSVNGQMYVEYNGVEIAAWDGTDQSGDLVTNGEYYVKVDNVNPYGAVDSVSKMVTVDRSLAKVEVDVYNEAGEVVRHIYAYVNDPNNAPMDSVNLSSGVIKPTADTTPTAGGTNVVMITTPNGVTVVWDGRGDNGAIVGNGRYEVTVHYTDGKGSEQTITQGITVENGKAPVGNGEVYASPNVLKGGVKATMVKVNSGMSLTVKVRLYDLAGELVKTVEGSAGANETGLDVTGLSSGLYFVVADLTDTSGRYIGKKTTRIVIQR